MYSIKSFTELLKDEENRNLWKRWSNSIGSHVGSECFTFQICGICYVIVVFVNMSKLAFSEYYLISSACFKLPPDSKSNCCAIQERSTGKTLEVLARVHYCTFYTGRLRPEVQPLPLYNIPFLIEKGPLSYTFDLLTNGTSYTYLA